MGHSKEKLEHQSLVTVRQTWILHSDFRGSIERVILLCRKIVSSFVLLHIFVSFLCCLAEKGQGEASKRLKIAEKLQSVYLKIDKKHSFLLFTLKLSIERNLWLPTLHLKEFSHLKFCLQMFASFHSYSNPHIHSLIFKGKLNSWQRKDKKMSENNEIYFKEDFKIKWINEERLNTE